MRARGRAGVGLMTRSSEGAISGGRGWSIADSYCYRAGTRDRILISDRRQRYLRRIEHAKADEGRRAEEGRGAEELGQVGPRRRARRAELRDGPGHRERRAAGEEGH